MPLEGPNVRKLIVLRLSQLIVPPGGGPGHAIQALISGQFGPMAKQAAKEIHAAIAKVRESPSNPYGDDDEKIAAAVLHQIAEKRKGGPIGPPR